MKLTLKCVNWTVLLVASCASAMAASQSSENSHYGCKYLEEKASPQAIEGRDGFIFRIQPDFRMSFSLTDQTADNLARLSLHLRRHGTQLIFVPVPTKTLAMPNHVPERAKLYGFDTEIARGQFEATLERLEAAGVTTVNLLQAFSKAEEGAEPFFKTDFHWNSDGARLAAQEIGKVIKAQPDYPLDEEVVFETTQKEKVVSFSRMRNNLQLFCKDQLPLAEAFQYETVEKASEGATEESGGLDLFGDESADPIALVGTSFSDVKNANFGGFIRQYSGLRLTNHAVTGGNQFGAILSYLTSTDFQENRPKFLIWETPIYNNLGQYGFAPWVELWAAAAQDCQPVLAASKEDARTVSATLTQPWSDTDAALFINAGDDLVRNVAIKAELHDGRVRNASMSRSDRLRSSGRFYLPLMAVDGSQADRFQISFSRPVQALPELQFCSY